MFLLSGKVNFKHEALRESARIDGCDGREKSFNGSIAAAECNEGG